MLWLFACIILLEVVIGGLYCPVAIYLDALIFRLFVFDVVARGIFLHFSTEVAVCRTTLLELVVVVLGSSSFESELLECSAARLNPSFSDDFFYDSDAMLFSLLLASSSSEADFFVWSCLESVVTVVFSSSSLQPSVSRTCDSEATFEAKLISTLKVDFADIFWPLLVFRLESYVAYSML